MIASISIASSINCGRHKTKKNFSREQFGTKKPEAPGSIKVLSKNKRRRRKRRRRCSPVSPTMARIKKTPKRPSSTPATLRCKKAHCQIPKSHSQSDLTQRPKIPSRYQPGVYRVPESRRKRGFRRKHSPTSPIRPERFSPWPQRTVTPKEDEGRLTYLLKLATEEEKRRQALKELVRDGSPLIIFGSMNKEPIHESPEQTNRQIEEMLEEIDALTKSE